ncbi:MAG: AbrB family transcriptional regulator [Pseudomonadota bacterium]
MRRSTFLTDLRATLIAVAVGAVGALLGWLLHFPLFILTGPALVVSVVGIIGPELRIAPLYRDAAFVILGIGIGAGVTPQAGQLLLSLPLAALGIFVMLIAIIWLSRWMLVGAFRFDRRSAVLAGSPGHLSYVLGLGLSFDLDTTRITVVQTVRLLALTFLVPLAALAMGVTVDANVLIAGASMAWHHLALVAAIALGASLVLTRLKVPAPFLVGGLLTSSATHVMDLTPGSLPPGLAWPAFLVLGTLIGSRFTTITVRELGESLLAGLGGTLIALCCAGLAAFLIAPLIDVPLIHVLVAFAPGGLETMIATGAVLGANPGFVAACHVLRLFILTFLVPLMLGKSAQRPNASRS